MRAITLWQPWASFLLAVDDYGWRPKRHETRSWPTTYRGPLAIHAAQREPGHVRAAFTSRGPLRDLMLRYLDTVVGRSAADDATALFRALPRGCVLGVVDLAECWRIGPDSSGRVGPADVWLGDFTDGRWAWDMRSPRRLRVPIPYRGRQGLWTLPSDVLRGAPWWPL